MGVQEGPKAPKDPIKKRSCIYLMLDSIIQGSKRGNGKISDEIYLDDGRIQSKAKIVGMVTKKAILDMFQTSQSFHQLVYSIGITITEAGELSQIPFTVMNYGKTNRYGGGSLGKLNCKTNGEENILSMEEVKLTTEDDVVGMFVFEFEKPMQTAKVTVRLYLNDGYEVPELIVDPPVEFDCVQYKQMVAQSLIQTGNTTRLKKAIHKASDGEEVTLAFIGGSITQGAGAKPIHKQCYAYKMFERFCRSYSNPSLNNCHFIKAGVGGTPSELGMLRYERDVLRNHSVEPDIVVVEFAVNDNGDETRGNCYESLVYDILSAPNHPAVILLFSVFADDFNLEERLIPVGLAYDLPMVSIKQAVVPQFYKKKDEGNVISKRQFFYDCYHPTNDGHTIMADCLIHLCEAARKEPQPESDINLMVPYAIGRSFCNVKLIDRINSSELIKIDAGSFCMQDTELQCVEMDANPYSTPQFPYNWMHHPKKGDQALTLTLTAKRLLVIMKDSGDNRFGKAVVMVDHMEKMILDPHINNWTHCNAILVFDEEVPVQHVVTITMTKEDMDKYFTILGFGVVF